MQSKLSTFLGQGAAPNYITRGIHRTLRMSEPHQHWMNGATTSQSFTALPNNWKETKGLLSLWRTEQANFFEVTHTLLLRQTFQAVRQQLFT